MPDPPVEVTIRLFGWASGESEVEITIPDGTELAGLLERIPPAEAALVFARLRRRLVAELTDAFGPLESSGVEVTARG